MQVPSGPTITLRDVEKAVAKLDKLTSVGMRKTRLPGLAIAVVFQDRLVYAKGFGVREVGRNTPINSNAVFQLASSSKSLASTVLASLVGQGTVSWDSRIASLDPSFAMFDPAVTPNVTLRDFLCHRSGLPHEAGDLLESLGFTRQEILYRLRYQPPVGTFREYYAYTNFGYTEGVIAAAKAAHVPWESLCEKLLYRPLGMQSTSSRYSDFEARRNRVTGHVLVGKKWIQQPDRNPDAQSPAGGVTSSVKDVAKWMRLQINGGLFEGQRIVDQAALSETHKEQMARATGGFYGLGWNVGHDPEGRLRLSHSGAFAAGAAACFALVPEEQLGIVVVSNGEAIGVTEGLQFTFLDNAIYGAPTKDWLAVFKKAYDDLREAWLANSKKYDHPPVFPVPPRENAAYLGTYTNDFYGDISIKNSTGGGLAIVEGPLKKTFPMSHYDGNTFTYFTEGGSSTGDAGIYFQIGSDGHGESVRGEDLDINKTGTFVRVPNPSPTEHPAQ